MSPQKKHPKVTDFLDRDEIHDLIRPSNWQGWLSLIVSWSIIAFSFLIVAIRPGVLTVILALILIGGRQLGLAILMHECAHRSLFRSRRLNDWAGKWLCAAPSWQQLDKYREHHLRHHNHTGHGKRPRPGTGDAVPDQPRIAGP